MLSNYITPDHAFGFSHIEIVVNFRWLKTTKTHGLALGNIWAKILYNLVLLSVYLYSDRFPACRLHIEDC